MHNYLTSILESTNKRVEELKVSKPSVSSISKHLSFFEALNKDHISIIAEVKKASPSLGIIDPNFDYLKVANKYIENKVDAISVLTEPTKFLGSNDYLIEISKLSKTPLLRKDFIIDEKQIFESCIIGASAILLIVHILSDYELKSLFETAKELGLDVLVETHTLEEIERANNIGADIIGINNRNLETFEVNIENSLKLVNEINFKQEVSRNTKILKVSESGIKTKEDIQKLENSGFDAVLIGEAFIRNLL